MYSTFTHPSNEGLYSLYNASYPWRSLFPPTVQNNWSEFRHNDGGTFNSTAAWLPPGTYSRPIKQRRSKSFMIRDLIELDCEKPTYDFHAECKRPDCCLQKRVLPAPPPEPQNSCKLFRPLNVENALASDSHHSKEPSSNSELSSATPESQPSLTHSSCACQVKKAKRKATKAKRVRTIFKQNQLKRLEFEFERTQYMVGAERSRLASELGLSKTQVKVWFQNRRIKQRNQFQKMQRSKMMKLEIGTVDSQSDVEDNISKVSSTPTWSEESSNEQSEKFL